MWWVLCVAWKITFKIHRFQFSHHHHHHHVPEELGVFPVPWSSKWSWSIHLFFGRPMFLRPFGLYCNACFGILFVSILCTCCSHYFWYCFVSSTMFCAPVFSLKHWFFPNTLIFLLKIWTEYRGTVAAVPHKCYLPIFPILFINGTT